MDPASLIAGLFRFEFEAILAEPDRLGAFMDLCELIEELAPRAKDAAEKLGLTGVEIPGWEVVRREGNRFVENVHVRELLSECSVHQLPEIYRKGEDLAPALLEAVSKALGSISESRWQTLCDAAGRLDAERAVSQCGAKVFLRKKGSRNGEIKQ